jgi:hypothetical protein
VPAHINSDVTISQSELIFCTGGSQTVVLIDLDTMAATRFVDESPGAVGQWSYPRQAMSTVADTFGRGSLFADADLYVSALQITGGVLFDGIYACQLSADETLLFTANRGQNHITIYDYPQLSMRLRVPMPDLQNFDERVPSWGDPRLGFHHSYLVSPTEGS